MSVSPSTRAGWRCYAIAMVSEVKPGISPPQDLLSQSMVGRHGQEALGMWTRLWSSGLHLLGDLQNAWWWCQPRAVMATSMPCSKTWWEICGARGRKKRRTPCRALEKENRRPRLPPREAVGGETNRKPPLQAASKCSIVPSTSSPKHKFKDMITKHIQTMTTEHQTPSTSAWFLSPGNASFSYLESPDSLISPGLT